MIFFRFILLTILVALLQPAISLAQDESPPVSPAEVSEPVITNYQDWTIQCLPVSTENQSSRCAMIQQLLVDSGERLLAMQVSEAGIDGESQDLAMVAVFSLPLGVYLPTGLRISIDKGATTLVDYERCDRGGCYAGLLLGNDLTEAMKSGTDLITRFNNLDGRTISARLSLRGFTAAYSALVEEIRE